MSSRTASNSISYPPHLQAQLNLQSGILHAEDKDYTTASLYFCKTFINAGRRKEGTGSIEVYVVV